ncbi:MAG TPA: TetR/AcrR family transcriptional regulator [Steroidobacteraceae bacterium]|nr:TetR/AcrR family transcriptional regulator [Steroidobacteraceae bacterium]
MSTSTTRQKILDAAQRLLETDGLARLTTKELAAAAGCAEGTLFKHFRSKKDIIIAVVTENAPRFRAAVSQLRPGERTVAKNLEELALMCIRFSEKLIPLGASLLGDSALLARHRALDPGRGPKETHELIAAYIAEEQKAGHVDARIEPLSVALLLFGPCFHRVFIRQVVGKNPPPADDRKFVASLVATIMQGLAPRG